MRCLRLNQSFFGWSLQTGTKAIGLISLFAINECLCRGIIGISLVLSQALIPSPSVEEGTLQRSIPPNPCNPSPCGVGSECRSQGTSATCKCPINYVGDPYTGCRPKCVQNSDCPRDKSCANNRCVNPCPSAFCGLNAECRVINHYPVCSCLSGYTGDASSACRPIPVESRPIEPDVAKEHCVPSPCGPNSACREVSNKAVCSCQSGFVGVPAGYSCRPECSSNSECSQSLACINQKCRDPCPGVCDERAVCRVINHNPICNCRKELTGDPFVRCQPFPVLPQEPVVEERPNPCIPSPCGPNSQCQVVRNEAQCGCQDGMIGTVPNCRPQCIRNSNCPSNLACINQKCKDPCAGVCGAETQCQVVGHNPVCSCKESYTGDPSRNCVPIQLLTPTPNRCIPSPCGANATCREQSGSAICQCLPEYFGDARQGCKPECVLNFDCASTKVCVNQKCRDPCPGLCGNNAECRVVNHFATCYCPQGYTGSPLDSCKVIPVEVPRPTQPTVAEKCTPCSPSPCGPYSVCHEVDCRPSCRPKECLLNSDCQSTLACINQKCRDPCAGVCGQDAQCRVVGHNPICSCPRGKTGDPFIECRPTPVPPPRPQCRLDLECPINKICSYNKCINPCTGSVNPCGDTGQLCMTVSLTRTAVASPLRSNISYKRTSVKGKPVGTPEESALRVTIGEKNSNTKKKKSLDQHQVEKMLKRRPEAE